MSIAKQIVSYKKSIAKLEKEIAENDVFMRSVTTAVGRDVLERVMAPKRQRLARLREDVAELEAMLRDPRQAELGLPSSGPLPSGTTERDNPPVLGKTAKKP